MNDRNYVPSFLKNETNRKSILRSRVASLLLIFMIGAVSAVQANDVLEYLPEDALGFAVVSDLNGFNAKAEKLIQLFEVPFPAPLTFVQFATGLSDGLDLEGDLLLAVLPGTSSAPTPQPMVLLPIADYEKFAASINGDKSGEVCRVTVAGEEVLIAKQGPYALLMNTEHRESLETILSLEPQPVAVLESLQSWILGNDVTVALMPAGVKMLLGMATQGLDAQQQAFKEAFEGQGDDEEFSQMVDQMEQNLAMTRMMLKLVDRELQLGAIGLAVDEQSNIRLAERALLTKDGLAGSLKQVDPGSRSPLAGFENQSFVVAGGGPIPMQWGDKLARMSRKMLESMPQAYGLEELEEEKWLELEETYRDMMNNFTYSSMIMAPGEEGDPLFSNIFGIAKTADAEGYLKSYEAAMDTLNSIMAESTGDIQLHYEVTPTTVGEHKACEILVDVAAVAQDPNVPMFNWMLESMFGEDGKFRQMLVAANKQTLVYGMSGQEKLTPLIENVDDEELGLSKAPEVQATMKLMPENAPWKIMVSPPGCVQWATRFTNEFLAHLQGGTVEIPEFPACPPIGVSLNLSEARFECDMVWTVDTLKALAAYIKTCQDL